MSSFISLASPTDASDSEQSTNANLNNFEIEANDKTEHHRSLDLIIDEAVAASTVGVLARNKECVAARVATAYALFVAIADEIEAIKYVLAHSNVKGRQRLPSKKKPALLALIIAFNPSTSEETQVCYGLAYVLIAMRNRGVEADRVAAAYMQTTVQECRKEVRTSRSALARTQYTEAQTVPDAKAPDALAHGANLPPWKHRSDLPSLCVFRVDSKGAEPVAQCFLEPEIDDQRIADFARKLIGDFAASTNSSIGQSTVDRPKNSNERLEHRRQAGDKRLEFGERYHDFATAMERLHQRQPD